MKYEERIRTGGLFIVGGGVCRRDSGEFRVGFLKGSGLGSPVVRNDRLSVKRHVIPLYGRP